MYEEKTWLDLRKTGLLMFINSFLHIFGWCIVVELDDDDNFRRAYPARTKWRGFSSEAIDRAYRNVTREMKENIDQLVKDVEE